MGKFANILGALLLLLVGDSLADGTVASSLITDDSYTVEALVKDVFVSGTCDNITNIRAIGNTAGIGYFEQGSSSIGLERGVILATGPIGNAHGPNTATDRSGNFNDASGDPDLDYLATGDVKDAVGITFDFTPLDSFVTFRYVFASEEYCEFVGSIYNDVFGFFISGPGINGNFSNSASNVALIPGTNDFVSINNVNHQQNSSYYVHNELQADIEQCFLPAAPRPYLPRIEYDGFTRPMTAWLKLAPCETYRIRLVVADVGDNFFDSAVFLEAESFNLGGQVEVRAGTGATVAQAALRGCSGSHFVFARAAGSETDFPLSVQYTVDPASTAVEGLDFAPLPGSVTIPAGSHETRLPVTLLNNGQPEPVKTLTLALDIPCACYTGSATMHIADSPGFELELPELAICADGSNTFTPIITGGQPDFVYQWSTGAAGPQLAVSSVDAGQYWLTVTDGCGNSAVDSAFAVSVAAPTAFLSGEAEICEGDTAWLRVELSGAPPWRLGYQVDGEEQPVSSGITTADYALPVTLPGHYELTAVADAGCEGEVSGSAWVEVQRMLAEATISPISCDGGSDGDISIGLSGGTPPYQHLWLDNPTVGLQRQMLAAGEYILSVTDAAGCTKTFAYALSAPPPLAGLVPDCEALQMGVLSIGAAGGTPPYRYTVDGQPATDLATLVAGQYYQIGIEDAAGCTLEQSLIWPAPYPGQMVELPDEIEANIGQPFTLSPLLHVPESLISSVRWTPSLGLSCVECLYPEVQLASEQWFTLRVVDIHGCTTEDSVLVTVNESINVYVPTAFSPNGDRINDVLSVYANTYQVERILAFRVFNRWGGVVYEARDFPPNREQIGWDGQVGGRPANAGIYTYTVEVLLTSGSRQLIGGHALLMR